MTKAIRVLIASLVVGTALMAGAQEMVRVNVPFEFHVNGATLSAGDYTVSRVYTHTNGMLQVTAVQGKEAASFLVSGSDAYQPGASLLFHRYGDVYYLSGVRMPAGKFTVSPSRQERQAAAKGGGEVVVTGSR